MKIMSGQWHFPRMGQKLFLGVRTSTIRLWDVQSGSELAVLKAMRMLSIQWHFPRMGQKLFLGVMMEQFGCGEVLGQGWLEVGCDQLRLHKVFVEAFIKDREDGEVAREAVKTCEEQVNEYGSPIWNNQEKAEFRVRQGLAVAQLTGNFEAAKDKFEEAQELDETFYQSLEYDPEVKAKKLRAFVLVSEGEKIAKEGKLQESIAKFQEAKILNPDFEFDPEVKAKPLVAAGFVNQAIELMKKDNAELVLAKYQEAQELDAQLEEVDTGVLHYLCGYGSLRGYAAEVMSACDMAVERAPHYEWYRDSRGIARALTGDYAGAISDFEAYIKELEESIKNREDEDRKKDLETKKVMRQGWVDTLKKGVNPLTEEVLQELLEE
jgi:tetratricopeptide (TPR) repeat protein